MAKLRGNLLVGQSGGPTAVINSTLAGVLHEAQLHAEIGEIYGMANGIQGLLEEEICDLRRQDPGLVEILRRTPASALGSCRYKLRPEDFDRLLDLLKAHDIRYLLYIGGNDSADTSWQIARRAEAAGYEMRVIGLPKTVDNDLPFTDHCPGYGSAARYAALSAMDAGADHRSMRSFDAVKIIEAMGRNAGWIAAASALGRRQEDDPPHLVYPPERPVKLDDLLEEVQTAYDRYGFATVVVSEALRGEDGRILVEGQSALETDSFGHRQPGGVADFLVQTVMRELGLKARSDKPGTLQRVSAAHASGVDLEEAFLVGLEGVRSAVAGVGGRMVTLVREPGPEYRCTTGLVELEKVANREKLLPDEFMDYQRRMPTPQFYQYALPLLGEALPEYARLREAIVEKLLPPR